MTGRPPRVARLLAFMLLPRDAREIVLGDLDEQFGRAIDEGVAPRRARRLYWRQALASIVACVPRVRAEAVGAGVSGRRASRTMSGIAMDVRFALRLSRREKTAVGIGVAGLTIAIGLSTALFTVTNAMLFRTMGVKEAAPLHWARQTGGTQVGPALLLPAWTFQEVTHLETHARNSRIAGVLQSAARLHADDGFTDESARVWFVSAGFFSMTGARASAGRLLAPADDTQATAAPIVMNHAYWSRRFGGAADVVGRTIRLNGRPFTVVGIADRRYGGPTMDPPAFWAPLAIYDLDWRDGSRLRPSDQAGWSVLVQLEPGNSTDRAQAELSALVRGLRDSAAAVQGLAAVGVAPVATEWRVRDGGTIATMVALLIGFVLIVGCGNVANLLMAGAESRRAEIAVRLALGASRGRVVRQVLTESLVLGAFGAAGGLLLAVWLTPVLGAVTDLPSTFDVAPDTRTFAFVALAAVATGLAAGLAPARYGARGDLRSALGTDAARAPVATGRFNRAVIAVQAAIAMLILVVGASLTRGAWRAAALDAGFDTDKLLQVQWPAAANAGRPAGYGIQDLAAERLRRLPSVEQVALSRFAPLAGSNRTLGLAEDRLYRAYMKEVSAEYFAALGIPIREGRTFGAEEIAADAHVAVVAERIARDFWPGTSPVGDRLDRVHRSLAGVLVVGVAGDVLPYSVLDAGHDTTAIYRPLPRGDQGLRMLVVRTRGRAADQAAGVRAVLGDLDQTSRPSITVARDVLDSQIRTAAVPSNIATVAIIAILALAATGVYGLTTFTTGLRRREIAVRMALGATRRVILRTVLFDGLRPIVAGLAAGVGLAWIAGRAFSAVLLGVPAVDPLSVATATGVLLAVTAAAIVPPARRSADHDPAIVLKDQ